MLHNVRAGVFLTSVSGMFHRTVKMCPYSMWTTDLVEVCVLLICVCVCDTHSAIAHSATPRTGARQAPSVYGDSPGKNTGVGCHFLLHGIFPTQGSNPGLPHHRWILYHLSHRGSSYVWYKCFLLIEGFSKIWSIS